MLHLIPHEVQMWRDLTEKARTGLLAPDDGLLSARPALRPAFRFHAAASCAAAGDLIAAQAWLAAGALEEKENMACAYLAGFLKRHGALTMPTIVFQDPRPYIHFTTVPAIIEMRKQFRTFAAKTLPTYEQPLRFMDIGCGNGTMGIELLQHLIQQGVVSSLAEIILVDPFPAMLAAAKQAAHDAFPDLPVTLIHGRSEDLAATLPDAVDLTLCSLSIHHMPWEQKTSLAHNLALRSRDILLFELHGDHDTPELGAPELSLSVYQSYGGMIDAIFAHDAPVGDALACVDLFLLAEVVSLLTQARGIRTEYHMPPQQWRTLFETHARSALAGMEICLAGGDFELFGQHYRKQPATMASPALYKASTSITV